jgi:hypothetical protein
LSALIDWGSAVCNGGRIELLFDSCSNIAYPLFGVLILMNCHIVFLDGPSNRLNWLLVFSIIAIISITIKTYKWVRLHFLFIVNLEINVLQ